MSDTIEIIVGQQTSPVIEIPPQGTDGIGIASIELISTVGLVKTYRINYTNGNHFDFEVTDGSDAECVWGNITGILANQTDLNDALNAKADASQVYTKDEADALLDDKANADSVYTKTEADALLAEKADTSSVYTKTATDDLLDLKADKADVYTQTELDGIFDGIDNALDTKADKTDVYTKAQTDNKLSVKADASDVYTKAEADALLGDKANASDVYTKSQTDNLLSAKADTADLGALAEKDTVDYETEVTNKPTLGTMSAESADDYYDKTETDSLLSAKANSADLGTMSAESASDYYTKTATDALLSEKADIIYSSASGALVHLTDAGAYPVDSLSVGIEPVQDLHGYDAPWPAGGGKNLIFKTISGTNIGSDGVIVASAEYTLLVAKVTANQTYVKSRNGTNTGGILCAYYTTEPEIGSTSYDGQRIVSGANPFTAPIDGYVCARVPTGDESGQQIEAGSTVTSYAPYSNLCPITGWDEVTVTRTGKNLLQITDFSYGTLNDVTFEELEDGGIWVHGTASANARRTGTVNIAVYKNKAYTFGKWQTKQSISQNNFNAAILKSSNTYTKIANTNNQSISFTAEEDGVYSTFAIFVASGTQVDNVFYPQLELSLTASAYEPYTGTSVTIDLDGTRYGAQLNVLTGEMTVTHGYADENSFTSVNSSASYAGLHWADYNPDNCSNVGTSFCSMLERKDGNSGWASTVPCFSLGPENANYKIRVYCAQTSISDFKTFFADLQIVYPLATPFTVQLSPATLSLLLGENNIWADTGESSVGYRADTKLYIERLTQPTEDDMVANTNIASGKYFMVGMNLYLSTASIANGEQIVPNTNCTALSLADALNNLA